MRIRLALLTLSTLTWSLSSQAADNGFYLGAGVGRSDIQFDSDAVSEFDFDGGDTGWKLIAGFRPLDWLAVEASYVDFGKPDDHGAAIDVDGFAAFGVGLLPVGPVDLFAKLGLVNYDASGSIRNVGEVLDDSGTEFTWGAGVQFRLLSLSVRAEYEMFDVKGVDDVNMLSLSVTYTFL